MTDAQQLPPPSFEVLLQVVAGPCYVHLGLVPNPETGQPTRDLEQAKWCIDLLHVFEEKTRASATNEERQMLDGLLHELRSVYLKFSS